MEEEIKELKAEVLASDLAWNDPSLKELRIKYKAEFLTTFIQFVTHDGGCSSIPFDNVKPFKAKTPKEPTTEMFDRMFQLEKHPTHVRRTVKELKLQLSQTRLECCTQMNEIIGSKKKTAHGFDRCSMVAVESQEQHELNSEFCDRVIVTNSKKSSYLFSSYRNKNRDEKRSKRIRLCEKFINEKEEEKNKAWEKAWEKKMVTDKEKNDDEITTI